MALQHFLTTSIGSLYNKFINTSTETVISQTNTANFFNNKFNIPREYDIYEPTKIMCNDCNENFFIKSIILTIGNIDIISIRDTNFFDFINFSENIQIDGKLCKVYHLDKTNIFFPIKVSLLKYHEINITITTVGNCNNIKLNGRGSFVGNTINNNISEEMIKTISIGKVENYSSNQEKQIHINENINGIILTNINVNIINSISLKLCEYNRINYTDKFEIMMNTQRINDNTIYINLNECNYYDNINNNSLTTRHFDIITIKIGLDEGNDNIDFHLGCYSNNILLYSAGMGGLRYAYDNNGTIPINDTEPVVYSEPMVTLFGNISYKGILRNRRGWIVKQKLLSGDNICPILYEEIKETYIMCSHCKKNFDCSIIDWWINTNKRCPLCIQPWNNFTIYENKE